MQESKSSKGILLEAGTNELELLVFFCGGVAFGVNVAKVKEIVRAVEAVKIPHASPSIEGSFKIREEVLTLVNLASYLDLPPAERGKHERLIIIMDLNKFRCGMLIDSVEQIHRVRWEDVAPPSAYYEHQNIPVTAMAKIGERVIQILDFESITSELFGLSSGQKHEIESLQPLPDFADLKVLAADDSPTIRMGMGNILRQSGFKDITLCTDGQHAWETLTSNLEKGERPFDIVLSDIEMPRMDGLHLTSRIKQHQSMKTTPVILFSSIIREETRNKGEAVGADAQMTKFDVKGLVALIEDVVRKARMT